MNDQYVSFYLIDLDHVKPTNRVPCTTKPNCAAADAQDLVGCDAASGRCVCQRGYTLQRGICVGKLKLSHCLVS